LQRDKRLQSILDILAHGWNNVSLPSGASVGKSTMVCVSPSIFPPVLESLHAQTPGGWISGGACVLKRWPQTQRYHVSAAHLEPIWAPRTIIICDPENIQQRRFTGNFKEKPEKTVNYVNM
jgi:hypothetical protein